MIQQQDGALNDRVPTCPAGLVNESGVGQEEKRTVFIPMCQVCFREQFVFRALVK